MFYSVNDFCLDEGDIERNLFATTSEAILNIRHHGFRASTAGQTTEKIDVSDAYISLTEHSHTPIDRYSELIGGVRSFLRVRDKGCGIFNSLTHKQDYPSSTLKKAVKLMLQPDGPSVGGRGCGLATYVRPLRPDKMKFLTVRSESDMIFVEHVGPSLQVTIRRNLPYIKGTEITWSDQTDGWSEQ